MATVLFFVSPSKADSLHQGSMFFGGQFTLPFEFNYNDESILNLNLKPEFAYFVMDNLTVEGSLSVSYTMLHSNKTDRGPVLWGSHVGLKYYFDLGSNIYPFTGANVFLSENDFVLVSLRWGVEVPIGILWRLNEQVGLVFGMPIRLQFQTVAFFEKVTVNPGYLGVLAFF